MLRKSFKSIFVLTLVFMATALLNDVWAQCPMCRSAVESAMQQEGNTVGLGLNKGILYLLAAPYLMVATVGYVWYRNNKKRSIA